MASIPGPSYDISVRFLGKADFEIEFKCMPGFTTFSYNFTHVHTILHMSQDKAERSEVVN